MFFAFSCFKQHACGRQHASASLGGVGQSGQRRTWLVGWRLSVQVEVEVEVGKTGSGGEMFAGEGR